MFKKEKHYSDMLAWFQFFLLLFRNTSLALKLILTNSCGRRDYETNIATCKKIYGLERWTIVSLPLIAVLFKFFIHEWIWHGRSANKMYPLPRTCLHVHFVDSYGSMYAGARQLADSSADFLCFELLQSAHFAFLAASRSSFELSKVHFIQRKITATFRQTITEKTCLLLAHLR